MQEGAGVRECQMRAGGGGVVRAEHDRKWKEWAKATDTQTSRRGGSGGKRVKPQSVREAGLLIGKERERVRKEQCEEKREKKKTGSCVVRICGIELCVLSFLLSFLQLGSDGRKAGWSVYIYLLSSWLPTGQLRNREPRRRTPVKTSVGSSVWRAPAIAYSVLSISSPRLVGRSGKLKKGPHLQGDDVNCLEFGVLFLRSKIYRVVGIGQRPVKTVNLSQSSILDPWERSGREAVCR